jgi:hypothetical protein
MHSRTAPPPPHASPTAAAASLPAASAGAAACATSALHRTAAGHGSSLLLRTPPLGLARPPPAGDAAALRHARLPLAAPSDAPLASNLSGRGLLAEARADTGVPRSALGSSAGSSGRRSGCAKACSNRPPAPSGLPAPLGPDARGANAERRLLAGDAAAAGAPLATDLALAPGEGAAGSCCCCCCCSAGGGAGSGAPSPPRGGLAGTSQCATPPATRLGGGGSEGASSSSTLTVTRAPPRSLAIGCTRAKVPLSHLGAGGARTRSEDAE